MFCVKYVVVCYQVIRKDSKSRQRPREDTGTHTGPSYHNDRGYSPVPAQSKSKTHELNTTFKVSRENSMPINANNSAELPFVTDGAGEPVSTAAAAAAAAAAALALFGVFLLTNYYLVMVVTVTIRVLWQSILCHATSAFAISYILSTK